MSKPEILKKLKQKNPKINTADIENILEIFTNSFIKALDEKKNIELRGFGTFFLKKLNKSYNARNPKTGEIIYVPDRNKVRFRASKKLKKLINK